VTARAFIERSILPAALALLPPKMDSREARTEIIAIGLQESRFEYRRQIGGPAHGFWQFESGGGVHGVLTHPATKPVILPILETLRYRPGDCYYAIVDNDILACVFARLLLWTHPAPLPRDDPEAAWRYYIETWRPGRPHRATWDAFFLSAREGVPT
jgi:hypothetical protein